MNRSTRTCFILCFLIASSVTALRGEDRAANRELADRHFTIRILPLLKTKCFSCHGEAPKDVKGDFDIRSRDGILKGGESENAAIIPGKPAESPLFQAILWDGLEMPPKENDRLNKEQIGWIRQWIATGAPWPSEDVQRRIHQEYRSEAINEDGELVNTSGGVSDDWTFRRYQAADLWAYRPLKHVDPPMSFEPAGHAVDAFINRRLRTAKLKATSRADALTLIRRATFDLTGLPPTWGEVCAFEEETKRKPKTAYSKLIDRLLASDRYGEQMARHWLDVVRYADSAGFANDFSRPNAWRYRDYVIRSFNSDTPYTQFVKEQLAGDEIDAKNPENLIAVGYLRMGPWEHTGMSVAAVTRQQYLDDITNNVGETFLAHSLRCCKCHDHKFDPLPTRDYYRMQAVFATVQFADRNLKFLPKENTARMEEGSKRIARLIKDPGIKQHIPKGTSPEDAAKVHLGVNKVKRKQLQTYQRLANQFKPLALSVYNGPPTRYISNTLRHPFPGKRSGLPQEIFILTGGALASPTEKVTPGVLSALPAVLPKSGKNRVQLSTTKIPTSMNGRRTKRAEWITRPDNPLPARVIVNRVWQWHFGKGLAANANNFGKTGAKPTHPELLDWLASWFIDSGWSIKKLHRLIMTSDAYTRSGTHPNGSTIEKVDPDNALLARFLPRRLTAEELRDSMLMVSGELNVEMGGVPIRPVINREVAFQPRHVMGSVTPCYQPSRTPAERNRRTIYALKMRTLRNPMLEVFDLPGSDMSCERRDASVVTPQVFSLFNGEAPYDRSLAMAKRLSQQSDDINQQVALAFGWAFGRKPTDAERKLTLQHLAKMSAFHAKHPPKKTELPGSVIRTMVEEMTGVTFHWEEQLDIYQKYVADVKPWDLDPSTRALADLCLALMNSNEFVYVY